MPTVHLCLNLQTFLPRVIVVESAKGHDATKAMQLCPNLQAGEIVTFDKAYIKFKFLNNLTMRGIFWVGRAKDNMQYETVGQHAVPKGNIIRDDRIKLTGIKPSGDYPDEMRLVEGDIEDRPYGFHHQQFRMVPSIHCGLIQGPLGYRGVFQRNQAEPQACRLSRL